MKNESAESNSENIKKFGKLVEGIEVAMLTSLESSGHLHTWPMATMQMAADGSLWFFTKHHSAKVDETERDHRVSVSYADPARNRYVCALGVSNLVLDKAKIKELWSPFLKAWFPGGLVDPELSLLYI